MKRTCAWCKIIYDDGKRWPKGWPVIPPEKNHGACPKCVPLLEKEVDEFFASKKKT